LNSKQTFDQSLFNSLAAAQSQGVTSTQLNAKQIARLIIAVDRHTSYLRHLSGRMHQTHFPQSDPVRIATDQAEAAMEALLRELKEVGTRAGVTDPWATLKQAR
jgi:hypothetical protein